MTNVFEAVFTVVVAIGVSAYVYVAVVDLIAARRWYQAYARGEVTYLDWTDEQETR